MDRFKDKVVLVSGGSRGVGFATARELAQQGARIAITARGKDRLEDAKNKLLEMGAEAICIVGDVGKWQDAERMVRESVDQFGRIDILINNAGVSMRGRFADLSPEVCAQVAQTNLMGSIYLSRAAVPHLLETRGSMVFVSSIAGIFGVPGASIYCATKKALTGLAESLRTELLPQGVHIGVAYLGFTEHDPEKRIMAEDGSLVLPDRPAHHTQSFAARRIIRMIAKRKRMAVLTKAGVLGYLAYRSSPALLERAIIKAESSQIGIYKRFS